mmetsp:Transcript_13060/g.30035  ORF Transcript_13060/g.30035 Transcript_13060/m.30035 type:complete len:114 (-) Transcript_13060:722-1063(-)
MIEHFLEHATRTCRGIQPGWHLIVEPIASNKKTLIKLFHWIISVLSSSAPLLPLRARSFSSIDDTVNVPAASLPKPLICFSSSCRVLAICFSLPPLAFSRVSTWNSISSNSTL